MLRGVFLESQADVGVIAVLYGTSCYIEPCNCEARLYFDTQIDLKNYRRLFAGETRHLFMDFSFREQSLGSDKLRKETSY